MDPDKEVNIGRYLRFVVAFLLMMFSVLGIYEYYYGAQARKAQELQQEFDPINYPAAATVVTSTAP